MNNSETPKKGLEGLKAHFKNDFLSGFSVSLIALPLCLGIAIASGVPPLAGLVTAIVGGMLASRISGSFLTISGPAAGLIVITLGAAEALGGAGAESGYAGYPYAIAAIVLGGIIMALFGLLKVGKVGDFFPSAAVHGMLAAIGVIIMIKQFFPAVGVPGPKGELFEVAAEIPHAFTEINPFASIIALVTLAILIVHPYIKSRLIKLIPSPMWVLIFSIPLAAYFGTDKVELVNMPDHLFGDGGLKFPDFSKIGELAFWIAVISVALVSGIESLLSAKAVDSLDPYKRKSNLDRDLVAMGGGSSLSGLLGGLPMISEIVRSSANVNNGAKTQWANFFHGSFLLVFLLVASSIIEMIPLSALAAMLVFTGFKLASPREFKHMYQIGLMELEIFIVTLVAVLATDLVVGIGIGIAFKYILMFWKGVKPKELFRSRAEVDVKNGTAVLKLEGEQIFSNYLSLKKKMDKAVANVQTLDLDFVNTNMIDHTVMDHLDEYHRNLHQEGKELHLLNIGSLNPVSRHPLAARSKKTKPLIKNPANLPARQLALIELAAVNDYAYTSRTKNFIGWDYYNLTIRRKIISINNIITIDHGDLRLEIADIKTQKGARMGTDLNEMTAVRISGIADPPKFFMTKESAIDKFADALGGGDIDFEKAPLFSKNYKLEGMDENAVRTFFQDNILSFFESNTDYFLVSNGKSMLFHRGERVLQPEEYSELIRVSRKLAEEIGSPSAVLA
jgi:MFS superfamily sulfate permease-like transporter